MEQRKRALTNAAKRQTLRATAQPETASREMQARVVGKLVCAPSKLACSSRCKAGPGKG
jgi:hypothetical protein